MHRGVGGSEEGGEEGETLKVKIHHVWTVGQATHSSEVYAIYVQCMYMKGLLLGLLHGAGKPRRGFQAVDHWRLNDVLNDRVLTFQYTENLESARIEVWGVARKAVKRGRSEGQYVLHVECGSGNMLQQGLCDICATHVHEGVASGVATWCGQTWARSSSCRLLETE